jgi:hypothetical protein
MESSDEYRFEDFLALIERIWKPFVCTIQDREVSVTETDASIMMANSTMVAIEGVLFRGQKRNGDEGEVQYAH